MKHPRNLLAFTCAVIVAGALAGGLSPTVTAQNPSLSLNPVSVAPANPSVSDYGPSAHHDWFSNAELHAYYTTQFVTSPGFGDERMMQPFMVIDHSQHLVISTRLDGPVITNVYALDSIELIGVAKHNPPVAYTPFRHGGMSRDTHPLTDFEEKSLKEILAGKDVVSGMDNTGTLVIGALRAKDECLQCHQDKKTGDVLGALVYHLHPLISTAQSGVTLGH